MENNQLKTGTVSPCLSPGPTSSATQSSGLAVAGPSSPRQSVAVHLPKSYSRGLSEGGGSGTVHSLNLICDLSLRIEVFHLDGDWRILNSMQIEKKIICPQGSIKGT